jgi:hypothetical protein
MTQAGRIIFDGDRLRATLFEGDGTAGRLIVTFRQRVAQDGAFDEARPVGRFVSAGYAHLHLQSRLNDWYINAETAAFENVIGACASAYTRVVATGFSMGGYAVLRFSRVLGVQHALLISPQYSIDPEVVPWDRRFRKHAKGFDSRLGDLGSRADAGLRGVVLYDPFRPLDRRNADLIAGCFPGLDLCRLGLGGHPASNIIRESGGFGRAQKQLMEGAVDVGAVRRLHREGRRKAPRYWRHLAEEAEKRGHLALAGNARARFEALGGK